MQIETMKLNIKNLPFLIEIESEGSTKKYILKSNKNKNGIFINKVELY